MPRTVRWHLYTDGPHLCSFHVLKPRCSARTSVWLALEGGQNAARDEVLSTAIHNQKSQAMLNEDRTLNRSCLRPCLEHWKENIDPWRKRQGRCLRRETAYREPDLGLEVGSWGPGTRRAVSALQRRPLD